jgi:hypothetical protein
VNDELVDHVQNCGEKQNLSGILPSLSQQLAAVGRIPENCPKEGRPILMCIPQPGTNREHRCNRGLYDEPEIHRPREESGGGQIAAALLRVGVYNRPMFH